MTTLSTTIDETQWDEALAAANLAAQKVHDAQQSALPEDQRRAFVPMTLLQYAQARLDDLGRNFQAQKTQRHLAIIQSQDAASIARLARAAALPPGPARDALAAQVDALPANS